MYQYRYENVLFFTLKLPFSSRTLLLEEASSFVTPYKCVKDDCVAGVVPANAVVCVIPKQHTEGRKQNIVTRKKAILAVAIIDNVILLPPVHRLESIPGSWLLRGLTVLYGTCTVDRAPGTSFF